jgi:hypothetical protein
MQIRLYKSYDSNVGMHTEDFGPHTCGETWCLETLHTDMCPNFQSDSILSYIKIR